MSIEEREDGQLGELPEPVMHERGEDRNYLTEGSRFDNLSRSVPPDIRQQNAVMRSRGEIGSVPNAFTVTSTYDARPVNARDFLTTFKLEFSISTSFTSYTEEGSFQVPNGYIGVMKGFRYSFNPPLSILEDLKVTVLSDDVAVNNYSQIVLPQNVNDFIPIYTISNSLKTMGLRIEHPQQSYGLVATTKCSVELYGNLLLARGIPAPYEPTNFA